jgi:hypothetical protein
MVTFSGVVSNRVAISAWVSQTVPSTARSWIAARPPCVQ